MVAYVALTLIYAWRVQFRAGDDPVWLDHAAKGLFHDWTDPSPFGFFRPVFGTWLILLRGLEADSPRGMVLSGLLLSLAGSAIAYRAFRPLLPASASVAAATLLLIHPARQEQVFWACAQIDGLCLALSLLCLGAAFRAVQREAAGFTTLARVAAITALAALTKETALVLPVAIAAAAGSASPRTGARLGAASLCGALMAGGAALAVLGGPGRPGSVLSSPAGWAANLAYPSRLIWPGDLRAWVMEAKLEHRVGPILVVALLTAAVALPLLRECSKRAREPWIWPGMILVAAGALPWVVRHDDRAIGLGVAGLALLGSGAAAARPLVRWREPAAGLLLVAAAWSPLWIGWEESWVEASRVGRGMWEALHEWRQEAGPATLLVTLGTVTQIEPGARVVGLVELDSRVVELLPIIGPPDVRPPTVRGSDPSGFLRVRASGGSILRWKCEPASEIGIVGVECDPAGYARAATIDVAPLRSVAARLGCDRLEVRVWDGHRLSRLERPPRC